MILSVAADCETCDARIATLTNDNALREKTAALWTKLNGVTITPEMINCTGCRVMGAKTPFCDKLCPASFWHRKGLSMNFLRLIFGRKEQWVEFDTLYSTQRLERLRIFMVENNIPYKVRAALLPVPLNTPMPTAAMTQSLWYVAVRSGDVHRVQHYLRTERDT